MEDTGGGGGGGGNCIPVSIIGCGGGNDGTAAAFATAAAAAARSWVIRCRITGNSLAIASDTNCCRFVALLPCKVAKCSRNCRTASSTAGDSNGST